jgi:hypothetical protein
MLLVILNNRQQSLGAACLSRLPRQPGLGRQSGDESIVFGNPYLLTGRESVNELGQLGLSFCNG